MPSQAAATLSQLFQSMSVRRAGGRRVCVGDGRSLITGEMTRLARVGRRVEGPSLGVGHRPGTARHGRGQRAYVSGRRQPGSVKDSFAASGNLHCPVMLSSGSNWALITCPGPVRRARSGSWSTTGSQTVTGKVTGSSHRERWAQSQGAVGRVTGSDRHSHRER